VARALMAKPKLLLLDEPTIGLAPQVVRELGRTITEITSGYDVSIILVEQNAEIALSLAHRVYVLDLGRVHLEGTSADLIADRRIQEAYLSRRGSAPVGSKE
jgi:branched-chain amino acid transport system ATP-binding protein